MIGSLSAGNHVSHNTLRILVCTFSVPAKRVSGVGKVMGGLAGFKSARSIR